MKRPFIALLLFPFIVLSCQKPIKEHIVEEVKKWSETNCPKQIDDITRLDSMTYDISSNTVCYHYAITGEADNTLFGAQISTQRDNLKEHIISQLNTDTEVKKLVDHNVNFQYDYRSSHSGARYLSITITPDDYHKK